MVLVLYITIFCWAWRMCFLYLFFLGAVVRAPDYNSIMLRYSEI
jgi:hypothetical protein